MRRGVVGNERIAIRDSRQLADPLFTRSAPSSYVYALPRRLGHHLPLCRKVPIGVFSCGRR